jgi:hypothetical protein
MRALYHLAAVSFAVMASGCTAPETCSTASSGIVGAGILRESAGTNLGTTYVWVMHYGGDTTSANFQMTTETTNTTFVVNGVTTYIAGHVLAASLVDSTGTAVYEVALDRRPMYAAESTGRLRDRALVATLESGLTRGSLQLVLVTDIPAVGVIRAPLVFDSMRSGAHAPVCFRTGGLLSH